MRVFKWTSDFEPKKEPSIVLVWISFPNLRAHLFEKFALSLIAKSIGNPLCVDEATANGTKSSVARVCIEYDCLKPLVDSVWIVLIRGFQSWQEWFPIKGPLMQELRRVQELTVTRLTV
ncbi:protein of unknown function DUF4283 - like 4 [Theobroma cacao]|nr:protein of unknown function DUF4283 - like 4 [Theobroma cacao]